MSIQNIKTIGDVKASNRLEEMKLANKQKNEERKLKQLQKQINDTNRGKFKKVVIDSFLETFADHYGSNFDYNSLVKSITFTEQTDRLGGLSFDFNFKDSNVIFKSDAKRECKKFNENSYQDFITNDDVLTENYLSLNDFDSVEEYVAFEDEDIDEVITLDESNNWDGKFIPVSSNSERYGDFNRINKLLGFAPTNVTAKEASAKIKNRLKKLYNK